jgi:hypothetical protein
MGNITLGKLDRVRSILIRREQNSPVIARLQLPPSDCLRHRRAGIPNFCADVGKRPRGGTPTATGTPTEKMAADARMLHAVP